MRREQVKDVGEALAYLIDCTLATVINMAMKKSRSEYEFKRQKGIAQTGIDWAVAFGVDLRGTRGAEVLAFGSVDEWAARDDVKAHA